MSHLRVLTWNLNHRARPRSIAATVATVIGTLAPDVAVLTEYVEGKSHAAFIQELAAVGLEHFSHSARVKGQNQILIASRLSLRSGHLLAPALDAALPSNVLHVELVEPRLDIVGIRVPAYEQRLPREQCWKWLVETGQQFLERPAVLIGDFNVDPSSRYGQSIRDLVASGWQHGWQDDWWSFRSLKGFTSRIDHAFVSPRIHLEQAKYVAVSGEHILAGDPTALSDHAALVIDVSVSSSVAV